MAGSFVMGQDTLILKSGERHQIRLIEIQENHVMIEKKGVGAGAEYVIQTVPLGIVDRIILEDGTITWATKYSVTVSQALGVPGDSAAVGTALQDSNRIAATTNRPPQNKPVPTWEESLASIAQSYRTAVLSQIASTLAIITLVVIVLDGQ